MRYVGLAIAMVLAIITAIVVFRIAGDDTNSSAKVVAEVKQPDFRTVNVLVASRDIPIGTTLSSNMLQVQPWPEHLLVDGFVTTGEGSKNITQMITRSPFREGEPIMMSRLANPNDPSFLAADLPEGMRVVTIATDGVAGLGGFLNPGDRVDVMVTHPIPSENQPEDGEIEKETVTETLLTNIKVLAVDRRATAGQDPDKAGSRRDKLPSNVSLEVTLEDAQRIRLAQEVGYVSMVMRGVNDNAPVENISVTRERDISRSSVYDALDSRETENESIKVIRGTEAEEIEIKSEPTEKVGDGEEQEEGV